MHRRPLGVLLVVGASLFLLAASTTAARTVRLACFDGVPETFALAACLFPNPECRVDCEVDRACDGVCTFGAISWHGVSVCSESPCHVAVGRKRVLRLPPRRPASKRTRFLLGCLPHPAAFPCGPSTAEATTTATTAPATTAISGPACARRSAAASE